MVFILQQTSFVSFQTHIYFISNFTQPSCILLDDCAYWFYDVVNYKIKFSYSFRFCNTFHLCRYFFFILTLLQIICGIMFKCKLHVAFLLLFVVLFFGTDASVRKVRVVGGRPSKAGDWPWMAALGYVYEGQGFRFYCGGSLITNRHILTAGICVLNYEDNTPLMARLGDVVLNDTVEDNATPLDIPINKVTPHPKFTTNPIQYDIAILTLKQIVQFTKTIKPLPLPTSAVLNSNVGYVMGWGQYGTTGRRAEYLIDAQVNIVDTSACDRYAREFGAVIDNKIICAGGAGKGVCQDDSGSPLAIRNGTDFYVAGVASYRRRCRETEYPGAYANVFVYLDWILANLK